MELISTLPTDSIIGEKIMIAKEFIQSLTQKGIHYNYCIKHKEVISCDESRKYYQRFSYYIGEKSDYCICKNLLLRERKGKRRKFLIILSDTKQLDLSTLKEQLHASKLEFLPQDEMKSLLNTTPGNVSLFSLTYDKEKQFEVLIDQDLLQEKQLAFHPLYNGMSLFLNPTEALKFVDTIAHPYQITEIPDKEKILSKKRAC